MRTIKLQGLALSIAVCLALGGARLAPAQAPAEPAKPQKKDNSPRFKPTEGTFSTAVAPAEAKAGETVTYQVTVKLMPTWHIYKYAKDQPEEGPRSTQFDFFDTAGLKVAGDWKASREPIRQKEEAFPNLPFVEYFEDEVTWSIPLQVPATTEPGKKTLRCQVYYQLCNPKGCKTPYRLTLPDAVLTVLPAGENPPAAASAPEKAAPEKAVPAAAQPRQKDSNPRFKPAEGSFSASVSPAEAKRGQTIRYQVTAKLMPGWHIYKYANNQPGPGPQNTEFDFFDTAGLKTAGDWTASREPTQKIEEAFPELPFVEFYENEVTWSIPLQVPADADPGTRTLRSQIYYSICDAKGCKPPYRLTLPDVALTVLPGEAVAAIAEPATRAPESVAVAPVKEPASASPPAAAAAAPSASPSSDRSAAAPVATNQVEKSLQQGLLPFLLLAVTGGLISLVMPCVWPMVPITVNFFVKQGQKDKGKTLGLAITYCLSIIGIFTLVGVLFSAIFGAAYLQTLANKAWLNVLVAALFLAFGMSLLGLFEFRLPNFLLNASAHGESRGGLVGVIFMALTLTITSFTCTFPVVGGLLVMAAGGSYFYPIIGLATFATVLALPFFMLALAPGLLSKVPKSGDWMNAVKVVGGLVEIGAAFKFINTAECAYVVPEDAWFDSEVILAIWAVLSLICGIYLLGMFRTDHDHDAVKVGPGRILGGTLFLVLALYLTPALFGYPPQGRIWNRLIIGILPADAGRLYRNTQVASGGPACKEEHATSSDPAVAITQEKKCHGVLWGLSYDAAIEQAKAANKPVLIDFTGVNCANCRLMERNVFPKPEIVALLQKYVPVSLYTDFVEIGSITADQREQLADDNKGRLADLANETTNPFYVIVSPDGKVLGSMGFSETDVFAKFLKNGLAKYEEVGKVAQADTQGSR
ncbi:MAG TPA: cytochrome c biogenesis protein CcdA [Isosphaeraceae bacterium]|nr:cytochrome c biogenesis protein CcdA [Isosphaeraceae bacterium]